VSSAGGEAVTPERYQQINELLDLVLKLEPSQRPAYLDRVCAGDEALRREIESLLAADAQASIGGFLEVPAAAKFAGMFASNQSAKAMSDKSMILNERYEIERKLGEGGLGIVYRARDLTLYSKVVVIKVLKEEIGQSAYWKRKFEKEKEAFACCQNPHIVGIHDSGKLPSGDLFLVMEFVEGGPLRSVMKGEMPLVRIAHLVRQIGQALSYAHERVIFHRDLKPENIMLRTAEGEDFVILIDFGIATVKESQPATRGMKTAIVGTPPYMAPEQILGEPSPATDIYALGVIAYEMVTGHKPFNMPQMEPLHKQLAQLSAMTHELA
jgi:eukaryotic-like serine/threonine-protein kinase